MKFGKKKILSVVLILLFLALTTIVIHYITENRKPYEQTLDSGWTVQINDEIYEDVTLSEFAFESVKRGDTVVLNTTLQEADLVQGSIQLREKQSAVWIYLDGSEIYSYGTEYIQDHVMVGSGYLWVELPKDYEGKELKIVFQARENAAFNKIEPIDLIEAIDVNYNLIINNFLTLVIAIALAVFGWMSLAIAMVMCGRYRRVAMLAWIGVFAILISIYLLCYCRVVQVLFTDIHRIGEIEYMCLYFAPMCLIFFLYEMYEDARYRLQLKWTGIIFLSGGVALFLLNIWKIRDYVETLLFFQSFGLLMVAFLTYLSISWARSHRLPADRMGVTGIIVLIVSVVADLIRYQLDRYGSLGRDLRQSCLPIGLLLFTLCMFLGYVYRMMENVEANIEKKTLLKMAYTDTLTNIHNRAYCEEEMVRYEIGKERVSIINIDLNLFKEVNDTYGHAVGDELLMRFAQLLNNTFQGIGCVGRMGGDEFVVIMKYREKYLIEQMMQELLYKMEEANETANRPYRMSIAYGIADNASDPTETAWKVYERADQRMYRHKQQQKQRKHSI